VDVSRLNSARSGAFGAQSSLREDFGRVWRHLQHSVAAVPGAVCLGLMECTNMDLKDRAPYDAIFNEGAFSVGAHAFSAITRPRLWWPSTQPSWPAGTEVRPGRDGVFHVEPSTRKQPSADALLPGWSPVAGSSTVFRSLTTRRARNKPGWDPKGLRDASPGALRRWEQDKWSSAPY